ncbi:MAG TPA: cyclase family protein [Limnochordia bacterium]|nr:cyclase family protein [Limnochordia bacterium]
MRWIDCSLNVSERVPTWPGDTPFKHWPTSVMQKGDEANNSSLLGGVHFATHLDAPNHFVDAGITVEQLALDTLIGQCTVIDLTHVQGRIEAADLAGRIPAGTIRLLVKTANERFIGDGRFHPDYIAFSPDGMQAVVDAGVKLLGIDYASIGPYTKENGVVHRLFLGQPGAIAVENVDLRAVAAGDYQLICLPLKLEGASGAPCRVVLGPL